ncbi:ABC transporter permease [Pseudomonas sp. RIT-PI-q]|uniref:ABC transporter permease n=1 Tax=Pseudomonas sp. RIT-PI-q TaxID=1690247 RepID=UPI0006CCB1DA|nr:ABC transporter permease subunit [Pseudomonas sp. RIT-PI-q]KPG95984.1 ABC transporter permease [Pseudomonas sp. RIT-PI-q]
MKRTSRGWSIFGAALVLVGWWLLAFNSSSLLAATPAVAVERLWQLLQDSHWRDQLRLSLVRMLLSIGCATLLGLVLGLIAGLDSRVRGVLEPLRWLLMATPPVIVVVLAMMWFGMGSTMVVFMTIVVLTPGVYVNTVRGMALQDPQLLAMANVFRFGLWLRLRHLYLPALAGPLCAAFLIAGSTGIRIVVMAEVLGAQEGIGFALANAQSAFDSGTLYAWVLVVLLLVALIEFALLQPLQRCLTAWNQVTHD